MHEKNKKLSSQIFGPVNKKISKIIEFQNPLNFFPGSTFPSHFYNKLMNL